MNPLISISRALAMAVILMLASSLAFATATGTIKGTVINAETGEPLVGVSIKVEGTSMGAITGPGGGFVISGVPVGTYSLMATMVGFDQVMIIDLAVVADTPSQITIKLKMRQAVLDQSIVTQESRKQMSEPIRVPAAEAEGKKGESRGKAVATDMNVPSALGFSGAAPQCMIRVPCPPPYNPPPAHGGSAIVNGQAYDAMFFKNYGVNPFIDTEDDHLSTFAADVDDASYIMMRSYLERGALPPEDAVRVEEFVNHFDYGYRPPRQNPFSVYVEGAPSRFGQNCELLRIGIKGMEIDPEARRSANLVFVIDVSGSMDRQDRLELVKQGLIYLLDQLRPDDRVGIVIYGSRGEVLLDPTSIRYRHEIEGAIDRLCPGGSTNAEAGLRLAYRMAQRYFDEERINRLILCSDGVANVGQTSPEALLKEIKRYADMGITLSTVGFGMGNYNDVLLEQLGDKGNGYYAYVDDLAEARRVFVDNLTGNLQVIARDVKIQVDFNPAVVRSYRLLGYENRDVADEKFRDDREDGGEIGAGHQVTALYEIKLNSASKKISGDIGTVFIRYKDADSYEVEEVARPITRRDFGSSFASASAPFRLAAASAEFAEILKKSYWAKGSSLWDVYRVVNNVKWESHAQEVDELLRLISQAARLQDEHAEEWED